LIIPLCRVTEILAKSVEDGTFCLRQVVLPLLSNDSKSFVAVSGCTSTHSTHPNKLDAAFAAKLLVIETIGHSS
jgi:hypothetical protein